jgi:hypothetical protein
MSFLRDADISCIQLLDRYHWRSDKEILGGANTYRDRLFSLDPALYHQILQGQDQREQASRIAIGREYLEIVQRVAESVPVNVQEMVFQQLQQLNARTVLGLADAAAVSLRGDQYTCYVIEVHYKNKQTSALWFLKDNHRQCFQATIVQPTRDESFRKPGRAILKT